jgi:hypothetical protein
MKSLRDPGIAQLTVRIPFSVDSMTGYSVSVLASFSVHNATSTSAHRCSPAH